jgi:hypothetical protein
MKAFRVILAQQLSDEVQIITKVKTEARSHYYIMGPAVAGMQCKGVATGG